MEPLFPFEANERRLDRELILELSGELDPSTAPYLLDRIHELEFHDASLEVVTADLVRLDFMDSSGIAALLELREKATTGGCRFRLVHAKPAQLRSLEVTGLLDILSVEVDGPTDL